MYIDSDDDCLVVPGIEDLDEPLEVELEEEYFEQGCKNNEVLVPMSQQVALMRD